MRPQSPIVGQIRLLSRSSLWLVAACALLIGLGLTAYLNRVRIASFADELDRSRAQKFIQRGMQAWQEGDSATARLCFETASAIEADNLEAATALIRLELQQRNRAKARATFVATAMRFPAMQYEQIALAYHDALINCGWWEELANLGLDQLTRLGRPEPLWINAAIEGTRLALWNPKELAPRLERLGLDPLSRHLVLAQAALNTGDTVHARDSLVQVNAPLRLEIAWITARVWRRAGDAARARIALARTDTFVGPELGLLTDYWIMQDEPELQERQLARVVARAFTPPTTPTLIPLLVNLALEQGRSGNSSLLMRELGRRRSSLAVQTISALWLLALRDQDEPAAAFWLGVIREAIDNPPALKDLQPWNEKTFLLVANFLPLSRDTLYAMIFSLNPASESKQTAP